MAPTKGKQTSRSAINEVVTREYTINIHKCIHGVGFKKYAPQAHKEIQKFAMRREMSTPDLRFDTRLNLAVWIKEIRNIPYCIQCGCPENIMKMKKHQTSFICWLPMCLSPLSKIYS
ncbi:60S ribosomal protein L31 [Pteropus alecto]|uniref:Large ribosomal subunit protein eL31 n=1 Tax=Pteropus alecto TaxID=9402 RepID=L5KRW2_PTEAL|nr:60S ribosomal protein L31 [Pteropus alecto]